MNNIIWNNKPSEAWSDGLPIGNGRLAAMIWGTENTDRISLNHEWLWRGINRLRDNEPAAEYLTDVRKYLKKGDFFRASCLANAFFGGTGGLSKIKTRVDSYQPAGDLCFDVLDIEQYHKQELDLDNAVAKITRITKKDTSVTSSFIAHPIYNLIICRWKAQEGSFSGKLSFLRDEDPEAVENYDIFKDKIVYKCSFNEGIDYTVCITVKTDGKASKSWNGLYIEDAKQLISYVNIAANINGGETELKKYHIPDIDWHELLESHKKAFYSLLGRFVLNVEIPENDLPITERIKALREGGDDPSLIITYFNFGRYLMVSSSISGELPANLQGKWNDRIDPPWQSDYHFDVNIQMNYWMTEAANMSECSKLLIKYAKRMIPHGQKAAKTLYGCRGVYFPLTSDVWAKATPEGFGWSVWIGAAPWIAQHFWWHYIYSGDMEFLRNSAYPFFKEIALFYEDYLVQDEEGRYQIMPSQSPENRFEGTGFWPVSIGISSAMDVQLAYDALGYAIKSAYLLGIDLQQAKKWEDIRERLPDFKIGEDGRLLEWEKDRIEVQPEHRHFSHLYGLYPSDLFNIEERPKQYEAAIKSLKGRLSHGGGQTGWSRAWAACLFARIGDAKEFWNHMQELIKEFSTDSLLDLHPPGIFQIDGNFGAVAAVQECLVQYCNDKLYILKALPEAWSEGSVSGIRAPGGHTLGIKWKERKPVSVEITLGYSRKAVIAGLYKAFKNNTEIFCDEAISKYIEVRNDDVIICGNIGDKILIEKRTSFD